MDRLEGGLSEVRKGSWTEEEDDLLRKCMVKHGEGKWHQVSQLAGLNRCRKSCRLRWLNYLSPKIHRGKFNADEDDYILRLHKLLGNRWSLIAGRLPGRTANDVKNHWNSHLHKKMISLVKQPQHVVKTKTQIFRPIPRTFSKRILEKPSFQFNGGTYNNNHPVKENQLFQSSGLPLSEEDGEETRWWENLVIEDDQLHANLVSPSEKCWPEEDFMWNMWTIENSLLGSICGSD